MVDISNYCKHLDFEPHYGKLQLAVIQGCQCWERPSESLIDEHSPKFVQFCNLRGRLNHPQHCTAKAFAVCNEYEPRSH
jgi:hypothetical protein